jgi:hypothetical protein
MKKNKKKLDSDLSMHVTTLNWLFMYSLCSIMSSFWDYNFFDPPHCPILNLITPYIRILDFDWLIAGAFFVYFHI